MMHFSLEESEPTLFRRDIILLLKMQMNRIWDRVRAARGLTQSQLATALGTSQSAVSKLLKVDDTHPWTTNYIILFCRFCQINLKDEILDHLDPTILPAFAGIANVVPESDAKLLDEYERAVTRFANDRGKNPRSHVVAKIAKKVADRTPHQPSHDDVSRAIEDVILATALELE